MNDWIKFILFFLVVAIFVFGLTLLMYSFDAKYEEKCAEFGLERIKGNFGCLEIKDNFVIVHYGITEINGRNYLIER